MLLTKLSPNSTTPDVFYPELVVRQSTGVEPALHHRQHRRQRSYGRRPQPTCRRRVRGDGRRVGAFCRRCDRSWPCGRRWPRSPATRWSRFRNCESFVMAIHVGRILCVFPLAWCMLLAGCRGRNENAEVAGAVTLGGKPLAEGLVTFRPAAGTAGPEFSGNVSRGQVPRSDSRFAGELSG